MDYHSELQRIINAAKADKSLVQPWRNKIVARLDEVQAFVMMAKTRTNLTPPAGSLPADSGCTCAPGVIDKSCPVHRSGV